METRRLGGLLAGLLVAFMLIHFFPPCSLAAEKYPSQAIELFQPYSVGGPTDIINRLIAKKFEVYFGGTVIPQSKPGAGGAVLASYLAKARPDGYTLGIPTFTHIAVPIIEGKASYSLSDFHIIGQVVVFPCALIVSVDSQFKTFRDLITYAKEKPVKYAMQGYATTIAQRFFNLFKYLDMKMEPVHFTGDAQITTAILGEHVSVGTVSAGTAKGLIDSGKARCLFIFESPADFGLPADIENLQSLLGGAPFTDIEPSVVLVGQSKIPPEILRALEGAYGKLMKDEEFKKLLDTLHLRLGYMDGKTFTQKVPSMMKTIEEIMRSTGQLK